ncbi:SO2930 family diheme c-type cytochrome [Erythrobacter sp.]|uniref:SO2930 family diheme c-type cytochrome n=1 Tax=Erythrobacter sp. TaxID=1042 RepID=UPI002EC618B2|nr:SO2930 family diheme c-type cytochrome [Erythrobacter sp.]
MKRGAALLAAGALALAGAVGHSAAHAPAGVSDAAVMEGLPRALSEYGFFADLPAQEPAARVVGYSLNTPLWSDGADKLRFVYVPEGAELEPGGEGLLRFPVGSAIVKTFAFGEGEARRLIETRVLLHRADGWLALPYLWNDDQTDARLALAGGRLPITTPEGETISYRVPNKNQCKTCHSKDGAVIPIGPKARNLSAEWLAGMERRDMLTTMPAVHDTLPEWSARGSEDTAALARAYLDVNCAHCHQPGGAASNSGLDLRWEQDEAHAIGIGKPPVAAGRGAGGLLVSIAPGDPVASILAYRMQSAEPGIAMPELGKETVDHAGVAIVRRWISEMPSQ